MRTRIVVAALAVVTLTLLTACGKDTFQTMPSSEAVVTTAAPEPDPVASSEAQGDQLTKDAYAYAAALQRAEMVQFLDAWHTAEVVAFLNAWHQAEIDRANQEAAYRQALARAWAQPKAAAPAAPARPSTAPRTNGGSAPGGFLACVRKRESGGNYSAVNPSSGAGGAYQFLQSTWTAIGGTGRPQDAPPAVQDAMAAKLYANGAGAGHWAGGQYAC